MAEELQSLLDRIQKDGVDKADAEAARIVETAREKAAAIKAEAEAEARARLEKAEQEAAAFESRARETLRQAARDVVLSVGEALQSVLRGVLRRETSQAMTADVVGQMLVTFTEAYARQDGRAAGLEALVAPEQKQAVADYCFKALSDKAREGLEIKGDSSVVSGFRVTLAGQNVQHDFSQQAVADALGQLLRPQLAEIVREGLGKLESNA